MRNVGQHILQSASGSVDLGTSLGDSSPLIYELVLGLNLETKGCYSGALAKAFLSVEPERRMDFLMERVARDWRYYPSLMVDKFRNIHGSSGNHHGAVSTFRYCFKSDSNWKVPDWITPLADSGTFFFSLVFLLSSIGLLLSYRKGVDYLIPGLLSALVILSFALIEQLIEGHGRYKTSIYPFYFLIVPYVRIWFQTDNPLYEWMYAWKEAVCCKLSFNRQSRECSCQKN